MNKFAGAFLGLAVVAIFGFTAFETSRTAHFSDAWRGAQYMTASVFFKDSVTAESLRQTFASSGKPVYRGNQRKSGERVRILVVPGHDAEYSGTVFGGLKEVELNWLLADRLYELLKSEPGFEVFLTQTSAGYSPTFQKYFTDGREGILKFVEDHKARMENFVQAGKVARVTQVEHNNAPTEVALRLFGINKWANENGIDIVIHIHFNDYPGRRRGQEGKYSGFAIYVPENQYSNAKGSKSVASFVYDRLSKLYPPSNLPIEDQGIVEDQELIAIGSNNTLDGAGMLIEYGYIYESAFYEPELRDTAVSDLALQTFLGVMDFFGKKPDASLSSEYETAYVPHVWEKDLEHGIESDPDVLRLQAALALEGVYPPPGEDKNDCPLTGSFGNCTKRSVKAFQEKQNIVPAEGYVGEKTRMKLNEMFGK